ncbi:MAG: hypothetical protein JNM63_06895 [Spirochaetia bacterium]|nr:hypothetical protein [Spirochaetia bacterium]
MRERFLAFLFLILPIFGFFPGIASAQSSGDWALKWAKETRRLSTGRDLRDVLGVTHVSGKYHFGTNDALNEGADRIASLGTRVIKLWLFEDSRRAYPWNSSWPTNVKSLAELAQTPYYRAVFAKPFRHYLLETFVIGNPKWQDGFSAQEAALESSQIYELTRHLLTAYRGTGKTFVLQNWEGDNAVAIKEKSTEEREVAFKGMAEWMNCRQDAVSRARREVGTDKVNVVCALEVNRVPSAKEKFEIPLVIDRVAPNTHCDLYSISSWGTKLPGKEDDLFEKLDYMASKAPPSALYGRKNMMVGEFGGAISTFEKKENTYPELGADPSLNQLRVTQKQFEAALRWGVVYAVYWELYCNEWRSDVKNKPSPDVDATAEQLNGFWLIRPDGSKAPVWDYFQAVLAP